ncbi:hypothetical protein T265_07041 [Opisthorchis viverrini]|uniref:Cadherin domain-containing protein n=1 Tax=Opisthorchis viverrini TaxID=6198 RepID=A0A075ACM1_OPIVI|nr:hypothetical protein T265_07041 [Opisthorchis viverrini]KER25524.1 hypothetical protein T265_07041 [Opisthorchis viverrini]
MYQLFFTVFWNILSCNAHNNDNIVLSVSIPEEHPVGKVILGLPEAIAKYDHAPFGSYASTNTQIHLLPTHDWSLFRLTADGMLINSKRLDREQLCPSVRDRKTGTFSKTDELHPHNSESDSSCTLSVRAIVYENISVANQIETTQVKWKRRLRPLLIRVTLLDVNDNRPVCSLDFPLTTVADLRGKRQTDGSTIELAENTAPGTVVAKWTLTDPDTQENGITEARIFGYRDGYPGIVASELPFQLQFDEAIGPWNRIGLKLILTQRMDFSTIRRSDISQGMKEEIESYDLRIVILDSSSGQSGSRSDVMLSASYSSICSIKIRIIDVNDHSPTWASPPSFAKNEVVEINLIDGKVYKNREILRLKARDDDLGSNARISYHFVSELKNSSSVLSDLTSVEAESHEESTLIQRLFYLDQLTGSLQLRSASVDFDQLKEWMSNIRTDDATRGKLPMRMKVFAADNPINRSEQRLSPLGNIIVWFTDVNDNPPDIKLIALHRPTHHQTTEVQVSKHRDVISVSENLPSREPIAFVSATDPDSISGSQVTCELYADHAQDSHASIPLSRVFQLVQFTPDGDQSALPERLSSRMEQVVSNYKLITLVPLDREVQSSYRVNITCVDGAALSPDLAADLQSSQTTKLTSFRLVDVIVTDLNDNAPQITGTKDVLRGLSGQQTEKGGDTLHCSVKEHSPGGTKICQLFAKDADSDALNSMEWWMEKSTQHFVNIERGSGWLTVESDGVRFLESQGAGRLDLDREAIQRFSVVVFVRDSGYDAEHKIVRLTASATVNINVLDINDNAPKISEYNYFHISESAAAGTLIGTLSAMDEDQPDTPNSALSYHVASLKVQQEVFFREKYAEDFEILFVSDTGANRTTNKLRDITLNQHTGELHVALRGLDRERKASYKFVVTVTDGEPVGDKPGLPIAERNHVHTIVHIMVDDENDNAPRIIYPEKRLATFTLTCSNLRSLPYTIAQISVNDSDTGINAEVLFLLSPFRISTSDSVSAVNINTGHSNAPMLSSNEFSSSVPLNHTPALLNSSNSEEMEIAFRNSDREPDELRSVTLLPFQIDPQSGLLTIISAPEDSVCAQPPDILNKKDPHTTVTEYRLKVIVSDRGLPPLSTTALLVIRVIPLNAASPVADETFADSPNMGSIQHTVNKEGYINDMQNYHLGLLQAQKDGETNSELDARYWSVLNSPEVFWAAIICLTIATGVLVFLIILVTIVSCGKKRKALVDSTEPQENEWADHSLPVNVEEREFMQRSNLVKPSLELELNTARFSPGSPAKRFQLNSASPVVYKLPNWQTSPYPVTCNPIAHSHTGVRYDPYSPLLTMSSSTTSDDHAKRMPRVVDHVCQRQLGLMEVIGTNQSDQCNGYQKLSPAWRQDPLDSRCTTIEQDLFKVERAGSADCAGVHANLNNLMQSSFYSVENLNKLSDMNQSRPETYNGSESKTRREEQPQGEQLARSNTSNVFKQKPTLKSSPCSPKLSNSNEITFV